MLLVVVVACIMQERWKWWTSGGGGGYRSITKPTRASPTTKYGVNTGRVEEVEEMLQDVKLQGGSGVRSSLRYKINNSKRKSTGGAISFYNRKLFILLRVLEHFCNCAREQQLLITLWLVEAAGTDVLVVVAVPGVYKNGTHQFLDHPVAQLFNWSGVVRGGTQARGNI